MSKNKLKSEDFATEFVVFGGGPSTSKKARVQSSIESFEPLDEYTGLINSEIENSTFSLGLECPDKNASQNEMLRAILNNQLKIGEAVEKLMIANQISQNIIKNAVQDEFTRVTSDEEWETFNERLDTDTAFKLVTKRMLTSNVSTENGLNMSVRKSITTCLVPEFLLRCSWSGHNGIKIKGSAFSDLLIETIVETFQNVQISRIQEVISCYIQNKRKMKNRPSQTQKQIITIKNEPAYVDDSE